MVSGQVPATGDTDRARDCLAGELTDLDSRSIRCWVNHDLRQEAKLGEMIFGVAETIEVISRIFPLQPGDLIAMGTPDGVAIGFSPRDFCRMATGSSARSTVLAASTT